MIPYAKFKIQPKNIFDFVSGFFFTFDKITRFYGLIQYKEIKNNN